ncbi:site-2 protease family protein [Clostridium sp. YIM B02551]|uniref:site-2 protease family protein n=1 Tax=Clostridium sp. YIM B02551 TaxID=2910679 RepID=UPI001EEBF107|nr:site-2 protease family protein [Clostridium sp. YIM B02551]
MYKLNERPIETSENSYDAIEINKYHKTDLLKDTEDKSKDLINKSKSNKGKLGIVGIILAILVKAKGLLLLILSKFKILMLVFKLGNFTATLLSMLFMFIIYGKVYGIAFGVGFVLLLFFHEMGHFIMAKRLGVDVSLPLFIPFVGAFIRLKEQPKNVEEEAKIAIAGPLFGSFIAFICLGFYLVTKNDFLLALSYAGCFINLFNLIPIYPLDGGRVASAISPFLWFLGIPIAIIAIFVSFNPVMLLILLLGIIQLVNRKKNNNNLYYDLEPYERVVFAIEYFGLILLLGITISFISK